MAGNRLGSRAKYGYTDDLGNNYSITTDIDLATAAGLAAPAAGAPGLPKRFKPRGVYVQSTGAPPIARKFLVVGDPTAALYDSNGRQAVSIDGEAFTTTGRKGEQASF